MKLVFATNNSNKLKEAQKILPPGTELISLVDLDISDDIPETGNTFEANSMLKARFIHEKTGLDCFADDSGLEVMALGGRPGIYSSRYAGNNATDNDNVSKLLLEMRDVIDRRARFYCVITLFISGQHYHFDGAVYGVITKERSGSSGFGYDPVFIPDGSDTTFAQMAPAEKNLISHRGIALQKMSAFLI